jgi:hypothetical protein
MSESRRYTLHEQIRCVRREIAVRKNIYRKWAKSGRMKQEVADYEISCMQAVHDTLSRLNMVDEALHAIEAEP